MLNIIEKATENFCTHQLGISCAKKESFHLNKRTLIAYIDVNIDNKVYRVYVAPDEKCVQNIALLFLDEDHSDEETLQDMTLETTNLIVGSAKVIAQESGHSFEIETPFFEKIGEFDLPYDSIQAMALGENELIIAIKELDA